MFGNQVWCGSTDGSPSCAVRDPTRSLAAGAFFQPGEDVLNGSLQTAPEELPECDSAVCRGRTMARSRILRVETSTHMGIRSVVGEIRGERQPRDWNSRWTLHGERSAKNAAKFPRPYPRAPVLERYSSTSCARRTSRGCTGRAASSQDVGATGKSRGRRAPDERHNTTRSSGRTSKTRRSNETSSNKFQRHRVERW